MERCLTQRIIHGVGAPSKEVERQGMQKPWDEAHVGILLERLPHTPQTVQQTHR